MPTTPYKPGYVDPTEAAFYSGAPSPGYTLNSWQKNLATMVLQNLYNGTATGKPAEWNDATMGSWEGMVSAMYHNQNPNPAIGEAITSFAANVSPQTDTGRWFANNGGGYPTSSSGLVPTADTSQREFDNSLKQQQADLEAAKLALQYSSSGGTVRTTSSSSGGSRSSGGGGGGGSIADTTITPYQQAVLDRQAAQDAAQAAQFEKDYALRVQSENSNEAYRNQTLAQQAADRAEAARQARATTIAKLSANPGDAVEREFTMRDYAQPNGTPVDVFTGQVSGPTQNLSQLMASQASLLKPYTQAAVTGQPVPGANGGVDTSLTTQAPGYAQGTAPDPGFTKAPQFIAGDADGSNPFGGGAKPELIQLKTAPDGQPEARIFNHRQLYRMMSGTEPRYTRGTIPRYDAGTDYSKMLGLNTGDSNSYTTQNPSLGTPPSSQMDPLSPQYQSNYGSQSNYSTSTQQPFTSANDQFNDQQKRISDYLSSHPNAFSAPAPFSTFRVAGGDRQTDKYGFYNAAASTPVPMSAGQFGQMGDAAYKNYVADSAAGRAGDGYQAYVTDAQRNGILGILPPAPPRPQTGTPPAETTIVKNPYDAVTGKSNIDFTKPYTLDPNSGVPLQTEKVKTPTNGQLPTSYNAHDPNNPLPNPTLPQTPPSGAIPYNNDNQAQPTTVKILNPDGTIGEVPSYMVENSPATKALADAYNKKFPQSGATNGLTPRGQVNGLSGDNASGSTQQKPPPQAGTATAKPGVAQLGAATPSGYRTFTSPGSYTSKDGAIVYNNLRGDGTEVLQPDGTVARYDYKLQRYVPVVPHTMMVSTAAEFYALPDNVKQAIWSGRPTSYFVNPAIVPQITNWGMTTPTPMLTQDQFNALPADQRQTLLNGGQVPGVPMGQSGSGPSFRDPRPIRAASITDATPGTTLPSMLFSLPQGEASFTPYDYSIYSPPPSPAALGYTSPAPTPASPSGSTGTPTPSTTPPATTPPSTTPPATTGGGTTLPTGGTTGTTTTGGTTTGALPTGTANGGISTLSYGPEVWQNLPNLKVMLGQLKPADFQRLGNGDTAVPALGITIPAVNKSNYGNMLMMQQTDPDGWELLKSIYAAANRNLDAEMAAAKERAPLGSATYDTGLIDTGP